MEIGRTLGSAESASPKEFEALCGNAVRSDIRVDQMVRGTVNPRSRRRDDTRAESMLAGPSDAYAIVLEAGYATSPAEVGL